MNKRIPGVMYTIGHHAVFTDGTSAFPVWTRILVQSEGDYSFIAATYLPTHPGIFGNELKVNTVGAFAFLNALQAALTNNEVGQLQQLEVARVLARIHQETTLGWLRNRLGRFVIPIFLSLESKLTEFSEHEYELANIIVSIISGREGVLFDAKADNTLPAIESARLYKLAQSNPLKLEINSQLHYYPLWVKEMLSKPLKWITKNNRNEAKDRIRAAILIIKLGQSDLLKWVFDEPAKHDSVAAQIREVLSGS